MLQLLRQFRRRLAGTFGLLVTGTWLAIALAPCVASADPAMAGGMAMSADIAMEKHCPHCDHVANPCANAVADCELPVSLAPAERDAFKVLKLAVLPVVEILPDFSHANGPLRPVPGRVDPHHPPFQKLYCRYQE